MLAAGATIAFAIITVLRGAAVGSTIADALCEGAGRTLLDWFLRTIVITSLLPNFVQSWVACFAMNVFAFLCTCIGTAIP